MEHLAVEGINLNHQQLDLMKSKPLVIELLNETEELTKPRQQHCRWRPGDKVICVSLSVIFKLKVYIPLKQVVAESNLSRQLSIVRND